jgi:hypothetical protein
LEELNSLYRKIKENSFDEHGFDILFIGKSLMIVRKDIPKSSSVNIEEISLNYIDNSLDGYLTYKSKSISVAKKTFKDISVPNHYSRNIGDSELYLMRGNINGLSSSPVLVIHYFDFISPNQFYLPLMRFVQVFSGQKINSSFYKTISLQK